MAKLAAGVTITIRKGALKGVTAEVRWVGKDRVSLRFTVPVDGCEFGVLNPKKIGY